MVIYVEYVILDNFVVDFLLLFLVSKSIKTKIGWVRFCISSAIGTAFALSVPFLEFLPLVCAILIKLATAFIVVAVGIKFKNVKGYLLSVFLFVFFTLIFGGVVFGIMMILQGDFSSAVEGVYLSTIPLGAIVGGVFFCVLAIFFLLEYFQKKKVFDSFIYDVEIEAFGQSVKIQGFLDSGNMLQDDISMMPVAVLSYGVAIELLKEKISNLTDLNNDGFRKIEYITVAENKAEMYIFKPTKFVIYFGKTANILNNVMLGISTRCLKHNILLNQLMF